MDEPLYAQRDFDAVVLAGGSSRRMGGGDKTALAVGGVSLLDRVLAAVATARAIVVVGEPRPTLRPVEWTREEPPGGGPAAAVAAGLARAASPIVVVLAGDLPFVNAATVQRLVAAALPSGCVLGDGGGVPQWLLGAWPRALLTQAFKGDQAGHSVRAVMAPLSPVLVPAEGDQPEWFDCDAPADVRSAEQRYRGARR